MFVIERIDKSNHRCKKTFVSEECLFQELSTYLCDSVVYDLVVDELLFSKVINFFQGWD